MDAKKAAQLLANQPAPKKSNGKQKKIGHVMLGKDHSYQSTNHKEDSMIEALDQARAIKKHGEWIAKLREGKIGVEQFLGALSPDVAVQLLAHTMDANPKISLEAVKDFLDRAGYAKVQKLAVGNIDPSAPREQLLSIIEGLSRKGKEIEIVDDE